MGPKANLETYTTMQVGPPEFPPPYVIGYVKMKEGPKVFTLLADCKPDEELEPGEEMEMVIEKIREDINMAKGAKGAILAIIAVVSAVVSGVVAYLGKIFR